MAIFSFLCACSSGQDKKLAQYADNKPALQLEEYFNGPIKAWGVVEDWKGNIRRRFDVDMHGSWEGDIGTLEEHFRYYDGEEQSRTWTITKRPDNSYEGAAGDIIGKAKGNIKGNTVRWAYDMNLEVGDSTYKITVDDWMYLMNDGVLINKSDLKKFGIKVGELTLFMQKQPYNADK